jgi:plastocyanin
MFRQLFFAITLLCLGPVAFADDPISSKDQQWGDLTGRFIFDGEPPKPVEMKVDKDIGVVKGPIFSESLLVDAKIHGLANVLVWLIPDPNKPLVEHPDYEKAKSEPVLLRMKGLRFQPHCVVFRTGQTLKILNDDRVGHNSRIDSSNNAEYSSLIPSGGPIEKVLKNADPGPVPISCNIHTWESAYYLCQEHPYMALSSPTGEFTLKNLPVGKHSIRIWHEAGGFLAKAHRNGEKQEWNKGRIELEIRPGRNDLGDILVPAASLKRK